MANENCIILLVATSIIFPAVPKDENIYIFHELPRLNHPASAFDELRQVSIEQIFSNSGLFS